MAAQDWPEPPSLAYCGGVIESVDIVVEVSAAEGELPTCFEYRRLTLPVAFGRGLEGDTNSRGGGSVRIDHPGVSAKHAVLELSGEDRLRLRNVVGQNGVLVENANGPPRELGIGESIDPLDSALYAFRLGTRVRVRVVPNVRLRREAAGQRLETAMQAPSSCPPEEPQALGTRLAPPPNKNAAERAAPEPSSAPAEAAKPRGGTRMQAPSAAAGAKPQSAGTRLAPLSSQTAAGGDAPDWQLGQPSAKRSLQDLSELARSLGCKLAPSTPDEVALFSSRLKQALEALCEGILAIHEVQQSLEHQLGLETAPSQGAEEADALAPLAPQSLIQGLLDSSAGEPNANQLVRAILDISHRAAALAAATRESLVEPRSQAPTATRLTHPSGPPVHAQPLPRPPGVAAENHTASAFGQAYRRELARSRGR